MSARESDEEISRVQPGERLVYTPEEEGSVAGVSTSVASDDRPSVSDSAVSIVFVMPVTISSTSRQVVGSGLGDTKSGLTAIATTFHPHPMYLIIPSPPSRRG